ncbi:MAG: hypothetical protein Q7S96_03645 [bacterium]|nr:hypothetical protein [bacterium]
MGNVKDLQREIEVLAVPQDFDDLVARALAHKQARDGARIHPPQSACPQCDELSLRANLATPANRFRDGKTWWHHVFSTAITWAGVVVGTLYLTFLPKLFTMQAVTPGLWVLVLMFIGGMLLHRNTETADEFAKEDGFSTFWISCVCGFANCFSPLWLWYRPFRLLCHKIGHGVRRVRAWFRKRFVEECDTCRKWQLDRRVVWSAVAVMSGLVAVRVGALFFAAADRRVGSSGMGFAEIAMYFVLLVGGAVVGFLGLLDLRWRLFTSVFGLRSILHRHLDEVRQRDAIAYHRTKLAARHANLSDDDIATLVREYLTEQLIVGSREQLIGGTSSYGALMAETLCNIAQGKAKEARCNGFAKSLDPFLREQSASLQESIATYLRENEECRLILEDFKAKVTARFEELESRLGGVSDRMQFLALSRDTDDLIASGEDHAARVREAVVQLTVDLYEATAKIRVAIDTALSHAAGEAECEVATADGAAGGDLVRLRASAQRLQASMDSDDEQLSGDRARSVPQAQTT